MFSHILFDLDGTLTAPALGITNSFIHALKSMGKKIPPYSALCSFIGPPLKDTFKYTLGFTDAEVEEGVLHYREDFSVKGLFENSVYEGIRETLTLLKSQGKHLFVATSKPEIYTNRILEKFDLAHFFEFVGGADVEETRSEKAKIIRYVVDEACLEEERQNGLILMIGDRKHDIIGAHKNEIPCCACLWGYGSREEFEQNGADFVISAPQELL